TPSNKRKRKRDRGTISKADSGQLYPSPGVEDRPLVVQTSKDPVDGGGEPRKKKRKSVSINIETGEGRLISLARETSGVENGNIVQTPQVPLDASGEPRKQKKNKAPGNDSVSKTDAASRSVFDLPHPLTTSTSLPQRAGEDPPLTPMQVEDAIVEREKPKKARKKQKQKEQTPQTEATLPTFSSSVEETISEGKEARDRNALSGMQGAKKPIVTVPEKPGILGIIIRSAHCLTR
ncbi:hypothetical protein C0989_010884, partial [Termitomyces sp. Mn162]